MHGRTPLSALAVAALVALALVSIVALSGCGSAGGGPAGAKASAGDGGAAGGVTTRGDTAGGGDRGQSSPATGAPARRSPAARCPAGVAAFVESLGRLRRRLAVGLTYDKYVDAVGQLRKRYGAIPVSALPPPCVLATAAAAERALNRYLAAANAWGECLAEAGCTGADVEASLQAQWRRASRQLAARRPR